MNGGTGVILSAHVSLRLAYFAYGAEEQKQKYLIPWQRGKIGAFGLEPNAKCWWNWKQPLF